MGSKRSSKNPSNSRSSPPPANPPVDPNDQNPKNPTILSPSKSHKKQKLSATTPNDSGRRKEISPDFSNEISPPRSAAAAAAPRWPESDTLKLLKSLLALRSKTGFSLKSTNTPILLKEIKDWAPGQPSEKNIHSKVRHLRFKFHKSPKPGPESSEFDRHFYDLAMKLWGPKSPTIDEDAAEEEDRDSEGEAERDEPLVEGDVGSYKYLRLALEEYWGESKLNVDTLNAAFAKVNSEEAKRLDEKFREVFLGMLKLKMDKNKVSNEIIHDSLGC